MRISPVLAVLACGYLYSCRSTSDRGADPTLAEYLFVPDHLEFNDVKVGEERVARIRVEARGPVSPQTWTFASSCDCFWATWVSAPDQDGGDVEVHVRDDKEVDILGTLVLTDGGGQDLAELQMPVRITK